MSQDHALNKIRPGKSDNKRQSLDKTSRIQNADQSEMTVSELILQLL